MIDPPPHHPSLPTPSLLPPPCCFPFLVFFNLLPDPVGVAALSNRSTIYCLRGKACFLGAGTSPTLPIMRIFIWKFIWQCKNLSTNIRFRITTSNRVSFSPASPTLIHPLIIGSFFRLPFNLLLFYLFIMFILPARFPSINRLPNHQT
jgi:hypothetical protein